MRSKRASIPLMALLVLMFLPFSHTFGQGERNAPKTSPSAPAPGSPGGAKPGGTPPSNTPAGPSSTRSAPKPADSGTDPAPQVAGAAGGSGPQAGQVQDSGPAAPDTPPGGNSVGEFSAAPWVLPLGFSLLFSLAAFALLWRVLSRKVRSAVDSAAPRFRPSPPAEAGREIQALADRVSHLEKKVDTWIEEIGELVSSVKDLQRMPAPPPARAPVHPAPSPPPLADHPVQTAEAEEDVVDLSAQTVLSGPAPHAGTDLGPSFPVELAALLAALDAAGAVAEPVIWLPEGVWAPQEKGPLRRIQSPWFPETHYLLPAAHRVKDPNQFVLWYSGAYDCARPTTGAIWIVKPATVTRTAGGYSLESRGALEMR